MADAARISAPDRAHRLIAVNDTYRLVPTADVLYACDSKWWDHHEGVTAFAGMRWTQDKVGGIECATRWGLRLVESRPGALPSFDPAFISQGCNSGFQAINLAALLGAETIVLVGFDCQKGPDGARHFFGDHPGTLNAEPPFGLFLRAFETAAPLYAKRGITVLNASRRSAIKCFRQTKLEAIL